MKNQIEREQNLKKRPMIENRRKGKKVCFVVGILAFDKNDEYAEVSNGKLCVTDFNHCLTQWNAIPSQNHFAEI